jgi:hypothetical protein
VPISVHAQLQADWSDHELRAFTTGCTDAIVTPAKEDFSKAAAKAGDDKAVFPEKKLRLSAESMCACLAQRIATTWSLHEWALNADARLEALIEEAFAGGRCKPTGFLGETLERAKSKRAK